jgi:hypothetical protein
VEFTRISVSVKTHDSASMIGSSDVDPVHPILDGIIVILEMLSLVVVDAKVFCSRIISLFSLFSKRKSICSITVLTTPLVEFISPHFPKSSI